MKFSKIGEHTIKCTVTEQEITDLGFSIEDIMKNGARTQEFMNHIFDLAEREFETKFEMGVKTVRADFMPDHSLTLTFSEHPAPEDMLEHLKDIVNGMLNSLPSQKWEEIRDKAKEAWEKQNGIDVHKKEENLVIYGFETFDRLLFFVKTISWIEGVESVLLKEDEGYYLLLDLSACDPKWINALLSVGNEFADEVDLEAEYWAYLMENARTLIAENALETLIELYSK